MYIVDPKKLYRYDLISKYIMELNHINNFNKYKNELIRYFYNCDSICLNCNKYICNKNLKQDLCKGCCKIYCKNCRYNFSQCEECGDMGMFYHDIYYFNGLKVDICNGCYKDICEDCLLNMECINCCSVYCNDCLNEDDLCLDCSFKTHIKQYYSDPN